MCTPPVQAPDLRTAPAPPNLPTRPAFNSPSPTPTPQQHLSRELLLKLNVKSVNQLPKLERVDLAIQAHDVAGQNYVSGG